MSAENRKDEEAIYYTAISKPPDERKAYIKAACEDDVELLARVEALLKARDIDDDFLKIPEVTLDTSPVAEGPGTVIGRYKLLEQIGEGGFGVVYMAEQTKPINRRVALKIIKLGMDTKAVIARFEAERQALAMMDHPNIAKVFDAGATDTGRPYFVMELVKGIPITEYCDKNNLETRQRLGLFVDVCKAAQHAHQKGIIHRDIKPSNVLITLHDGKPVPKVIDFGIAKATAQRLTEKTVFTRFAQMIGTPEYMSPEQAEFSGLDIDARSDIYSLGVLLYQLLTGVTPFDAEKLREAGYAEMQRIIREDEPDKPSTRLSAMGEALTDVAKHRNVSPDILAKLLRGDLDLIVMKTLEKDRTRRYARAVELAADVERHLNNKPVLAAAPSMTYRLRKFVRRNHVAVITVSLVAAALAIGAVTTTLTFLSSGRLTVKVEQPSAKTESVATLRQVEVRGRGRVHSRPSPDGKYMSDVDWETGNLVVRELATGKERMLTGKSDPNAFAYESRMSPDSTRVAFLQFDPMEEDFDLCIIDFDGSGLRTLMGSRQIAGYFNIDAWSPDGKYIFGRLEREPMELVRVSSDDGSVEVIKKFEQGTVSRVQVSHDGRYLAYSRAEQKNSKPDIFVFDLGQNRELPLVTHTANDKLLGWAPDGRHIFFTSDRNGTWDGWLLRVQDGKPHGLPEVIKAGMGDVSPIGFTKSGAFYYGFGHEAWNVYTAKLDLDTGEVLSGPAPVRLVGKDTWPDWSPDGRYLAYLSQPDRKKPQIIRIRTLATGEEREIKPDLPRFDRLRWCPDSRHLLITHFEWSSPSMVCKVDVETGVYTPLVKSDQRLIRQAELSADGKILAYRIRGTGNSNWLIIKDLETGSEQELLQTDGDTALAYLSGWALSPDGKHVAFSIREDVNSPFILKIISVESGEVKTIIGDEVWQIAWTNDGRHLLFTKNRNELWRVTAEGAEPQKLLEWNEIIWCPSIHPDGQRVAFHSGGYVSEMWVLEDFLPESKTGE